MENNSTASSLPYYDPSCLNYIENDVRFMVTTPEIIAQEVNLTVYSKDDLVVAVNTLNNILISSRGPLTSGSLASCIKTLAKGNTDLMAAKYLTINEGDGHNRIYSVNFSENGNQIISSVLKGFKPSIGIFRYHILDYNNKQASYLSLRERIFELYGMIKVFLIQNFNHAVRFYNSLTGTHFFHHILSLSVVFSAISTNTAMEAMAN